MSGNLMTATLLDSYQWYLDAPPSWKAMAEADLLNKIRRIDKFEPTEAVKRGMAFEKELCDRVHLPKDSFLSAYPSERMKELMGKFYDACHGGEQQLKVTGSITVADMEFYLFGYADIAFPEITRDIKTTGSYKGEEKYRSRSQHLIYMYCRNVYSFAYDVADFSGSMLDDYHEIKIHETPENVLFRLKGRIGNFKTYLENQNLMDDYLNKFCRKEHK